MCHIEFRDIISQVGKRDVGADDAVQGPVFMKEWGCETDIYVRGRDRSTGLGHAHLPGMAGGKGIPWAIPRVILRRPGSWICPDKCTILSSHVDRVDIRVRRLVIPEYVDDLLFTGPDGILECIFRGIQEVRKTGIIRILDFFIDGQLQDIVADASYKGAYDPGRYA